MQVRMQQISRKKHYNNVTDSDKCSCSFTLPNRSGCVELLRNLQCIANDVETRESMKMRT
jgi:hypothetical protein